MESTAVGVAEPIPTLWFGVISKIDTPEDEATLSIVFVPAAPWILKPIVEDVAPIPATVPLSKSTPLVKVAGLPVAIATWPDVNGEVVPTPPPPPAGVPQPNKPDEICRY